MSSNESGTESLRKSIERKKEKSRGTSRRYHAKLSGQTSRNGGNMSPQSLPFHSRMAKKPAIDAMKQKLPKTPEKRAAILTSLIDSPRMRKVLEESGVILSEEEQSQFKLFQAIVNDATSVIAREKSKRNDSSRAAVSVSIGMLCGESVQASGLKSAASMAFGINWMHPKQSQCAIHTQKEMQ